MYDQILHYIQTNNMIRQGDNVLIAVSGGADSLALLHVLVQARTTLGCTLGVAHLNHDMRGVIADSDEAFVKACCDQWNVPFYSRRTNVYGLAETQGIGVEEAGRQARYDFFDAVMAEHGFNRLATAHHQDDQAETVLMRMMRGTGIPGAAGISPVAGCRIRPLLCVSRQIIESYCNAHELTYRQDSTNFDMNMTRNRLRHQILPELEEIHGGTRRHFAQFANEAAEYATFVESLVVEAAKTILSEDSDGCHIKLNAWCTQPHIIQIGLLREAIRRGTGTLVDIERRHLDGVVCQMKNGSTTWELHLPHDTWFRRRYKDVIVGHHQVSAEIQPILIHEPFPINLKFGKYRMKIDVIFRKDLKKIQESKKPDEIFIDYGKIMGSLILRSRKAGDYLYPSGMAGRKKLKDFFIDRKVPQEQRNQVPLLAVDSDVLWMPGSGVNRYYLVDESSKKIMKIELEKKE